jgi:hypothetical protein
MNSTIQALMSGAIDLHIHASFESPPRRQNMLEVAQDAAAVGMRAVAFKSKDTSTVDSARLVSTLVKGIKVYGGVVLDYSVGGMNPLAVYSALEMGGKIVWMPSFDSAWTIKKVTEGAKGGAKIYKSFLDPKRKVKDGLSILKGGLNGSELLPEVKEIISLIAERGAILDTSHLSPRESLVLLGEAQKAGLERVLVTHVNSDIIGATIEEQKSLAQKGAYLMHTFAQCLPSPLRDSQPLQTIIEMIKQVGPEHCVLATDLGRFTYVPPVEGMRMFIAGLLVGGINEKDIETMVKNNPAYLLGL